MGSAEYERFVSMLARNGLELAESPRIVAESAIVDTYAVGPETTALFSAEPFVDDPSTDTRLWPKDVITGTSRDWESFEPYSLRELSVEILKADVYQAMMGVENDTARPNRQI